MNYGYTFVFALIAVSVLGQNTNIIQKKQTNLRWSLNEVSGITWNVSDDNRLPHRDNVEMSGFRVSTVINYGVGRDGNLALEQEVIWPMLRLTPNNVHASLVRRYGKSILPKMFVDGHPIASEKLTEVTFDGLLTLQSKTSDGLEIKRTLFPSREQAAVIENYIVRNVRKTKLKLTVICTNSVENTDPKKGLYGTYTLTSYTDKTGDFMIDPGGTLRFSFIIDGHRMGETIPDISGVSEETSRRFFVAEMNDNLQLETPDVVLNRMFQLSKIRAAESIFATTNGLVHCPGGGRYYGAIWANDQAEYAGPLFPFLGYEPANEAGLNDYMLFARFMNPNYKAIPSAVIAEGVGLGYWDGAKDRGDMAMIAYGSSRFALASGNPEVALKLWPLISWCLEYCHRHLNDAGVVASDSDELEHRLPSGSANLHTSVLTYDALHSAAYLAKSLGHSETEIANYQEQAKKLKDAIQAYFAGNVEGFDTYHYYVGNTNLRAWICSPLVAGITNQRAGTIAALTSTNLWGFNGLTTASGRTDFWDRSTLYALRGFFYVGEPDIALSHLHAYSQSRLLEEHVPYAVEAYPEGNQSHLAAESALYVRIYTEGLFGIRPTGLHSFLCKPSMPTGWNKMALRKIRAFGSDFDVEVERTGEKLKVTVVNGNQKIVKIVPVGGETMMNL